MRNALAIARKELSIYFTTPWAWVVFTAMVGISAFFFVGFLAAFQQIQDEAKEYGWQVINPNLRSLTDVVVVNLWQVIMVITLFVAPFLSMRLFAEEKRQKTFELLMTTPVRPHEIVLGKYLAGLGVIWSTLALTLVFPLVLAAFGYGQSGSAVEWSTTLLGFFGLLIWSATCIAIGMFLSSVTESQMMAALLTFVILLPWMLLDGVARTAEEPLRSIVSYLSFDGQLRPLFRGVLELKALVFFVSVNLFALLLTHRSVEAQRWA